MRKETKIKILNRWQKFEIWLHSKAPKAKTKIVAFLGGLGSFAASAQGFVTGIPLDQLVKPQHALLITTGLFALAYWFRGLGTRVEEIKT